jgi:hypothetical protein
LESQAGNEAEHLLKNPKDARRPGTSALSKGGDYAVNSSPAAGLSLQLFYCK